MCLQQCSGLVTTRPKVNPMSLNNTALLQNLSSMHALLLQSCRSPLLCHHKSLVFTYDSLNGPPGVTRLSQLSLETLLVVTSSNKQAACTQQSNVQLLPVHNAVQTGRVLSPELPTSHGMCIPCQHREQSRHLEWDQ